MDVRWCRDSWVRKGLIVKVMAKELKEQGLYKAKGVITRLPRAAVAEVSTFDTEAVVQARCLSIAPPARGRPLPCSSRTVRALCRRKGRCALQSA